MDYIYLVASNSLAKWYVHTNGLHLPSGFQLMDYCGMYQVAKWYVHTNGLHLPSGFQLTLAKWYVHTNGLHTNGLHLPSGFQLIGQVVCTH